MLKLFKNLMVLLMIVCFSIIGVGCNVNQGASETAGTSTCRPEFTIPARDGGVDYLDFIALGDTGNGDDKQRSVAGAMARYASINLVKMVLFLGDNFYPSGVDSVDDPMFQTHFEDIYPEGLFDMPFYATLGNHDYKGNVDAQVQYHQRSERWVMPSFYYTFTVPYSQSAGVQFFALDTNPIATWKDVDRQLQWLEDELGKSTARWKIVFGHHPVYSNGKHGDSTRMKGWVYPLLEHYGVDLYLCGHDHDLQILKPVQGTALHYAVSGAGCSFRDVTCGDNSVYCASQLGFMGLRLSHSELTISVVTTDDTVDYCHVITK
ncbi:MAG: hypothetical protein GY765_16860 [bacterium]|nr:hypothetical protein [bacterium]